MSGRTHEVYSGIALLHEGDSLLVTDSSITKVKFSELSDEEINTYLDMGEWQDKAGAYGIQGFASRFIEGIEGDYYNVMGLPVCRLYETLCRTVPEVMEDTI